MGHFKMKAIFAVCGFPFSGTSFSQALLLSHLKGENLKEIRRKAERR